MLSLSPHHPVTLTNSASSIITAHPFTAQQWLHPSNTLAYYSNFPSSNLLATSAPDKKTITHNFLPRERPYHRDQVKRVIDSSTIQLTSGYVTLDTVRGAGSTYKMPDCMDKAPSYKLKSLLPKGTEVRVYENRSRDNGPKRVWLVRQSDELIINRELVRAGYAYVRKGANTDNVLPRGMQELDSLERNARQNGLGIFKMCTNDSEQRNDDTTNFIAEFEPLEFTTQTQWSDDGGKMIVVPKPTTPSIPPNPGDIKGCSDFQTYEDALSWYETYLPYYGDVAKLDRKGRGVPCSGLPHTKEMNRYRMKRPVSSDATLN